MSKPKGWFTSATSETWGDETTTDELAGRVHAALILDGQPELVYTSALASSNRDALAALNALAARIEELERGSLYEEHTETLAALVHAEARADRYEEALREIDALDRKGHDSEVAASMGYIARRALGGEE